MPILPRPTTKTLFFAMLVSSLFQRLADPGEIGLADMSPIIESEFIDAAFLERRDGSQEFTLVGKIGIGWAQYGPDLTRSFQASLDIEEIGLNACRARLIEARFNDPAGLGLALEVAAFIPGP